MDIVSGIGLIVTGAVAATIAAAATGHMTLKKSYCMVPVSFSVYLAAVANTHTGRGSVAWMSDSELAAIPDSKMQDAVDTTTRVWNEGVAEQVWQYNPLAVASNGAAHATSVSAYKTCIAKKGVVTGRESLLAVHACSQVARAAILTFAEEQTR